MIEESVWHCSVWSSNGGAGEGSSAQGVGVPECQSAGALPGVSLWEQGFTVGVCLSVDRLPHSLDHLLLHVSMDRQ